MFGEKRIRHMRALPTSSKILLPATTSVLMAGPFAVLFGMPFVVGNRNEVPTPLQAQWMSDHFPATLQLWSWGILLYATGFWFAFFLLPQRVSRPAGFVLRWWALVCGVLAATFVPLGTLLALPCLITLFWKRSLYFSKSETKAATEQACSGEPAL